MSRNNGPKRFEITLTGESPLLMHADNLIWREEIDKWRKDPLNKKLGKAGDDRSPAWSWLGYMYNEGGIVGLPSDNLMTCIRDGATQVIVQGKKTFKAQSQSGLLVDQILWPIYTTKNTPVKWSSFVELIGDNDFEKHQETAISEGFELFIKSAKIGQAKHVRVRPRFDSWVSGGTITVFDPMITKKVLEQIFYMAGSFCGIGDWRPKSPKSPGSFGKFSAAIKEV